jgi:hypothetical protein
MGHFWSSAFHSHNVYVQGCENTDNIVMVLEELEHSTSFSVRIVLLY